MTDNLPPLPTPARITAVQFCDDGLWFTADQMQAYARAALAQQIGVPAGWDEDQIAHAAMMAEIPDAQLESLLIALPASPKPKD